MCQECLLVQCIAYMYIRGSRIFSGSHNYNYRHLVGSSSYTMKLSTLKTIVVLSLLMTYTPAAANDLHLYLNQRTCSPNYFKVVSSAATDGIGSCLLCNFICCYDGSYRLAEEYCSAGCPGRLLRHLSLYVTCCFSFRLFCFDRSANAARTYRSIVSLQCGR